MKNAKSDSLIKKITDIASVIFILFPIYVVICAFFQDFLSERHLHLNEILFAIDIFPLVFAIVWLLFRNQDNIQPLLNYIYKNKNVIFSILGILVFIALSLKLSVLH